MVPAEGAESKGAIDVRFGSKADIAGDQLNVRFPPKAMREELALRPKRSRSGHAHIVQDAVPCVEANGLSAFTRDCDRRANGRYQSGLQRSRRPATNGNHGSKRLGLKLPPTGAGVDDLFACGPTRTSPVRVENKVGGAIGTLWLRRLRRQHQCARSRIGGIVASRPAVIDAVAAG